MKYSLIFGILLAAFSSAAYGMHQPKEESYGTYQGQEITPSNLLELLEREALLDPQVRSGLEEFIETSGIAQILSGADHQEIFFTAESEERTKLAAQIDKELEDKAVNLIDVPHSFIINVDNKWVIKRSRVPIARQNVIDTLASMDAGRWAKSPDAWMRILRQEEWVRFNAEPLHGRVYQNVSRAMIYLRAREGLRELGITNIHIPETHLVHIPGRPYEVEDRNCVVVELYLGQLTPLSQSPLAIDEEILISLVRLTAYTGWWTMGDAVSVDSLGRVYYHDHELPNRHSITDILHRDHDRFRDLVKDGWLNLEEQVIKVYAQSLGIDVTELLYKLHLLEEEIMSTWTRQPVEDVQPPVQASNATENPDNPLDLSVCELGPQTEIFE